MKKPRVIDLFCGGGGTSQGAKEAGAKIVLAINHWDVAVRTHAANFVGTKHINSRLDLVSPSESPKFDILFASPECIHHSRARGGRPTSDQQRSGANDIIPWIEFHRPEFVVVENVGEFLSWAMVGKNGRPIKAESGRLFRQWVKAIEGYGYTVEWRLLNAADYGAATSRERLFVIARKGKRSPIWPEPTHGRRVAGALPGMGLDRWKSVMECIDWSLPCLSVFASKEQAVEFKRSNSLPGMPKRPLQDKTLDRIAAGLDKFVGPFVATLRNHCSANDMMSPLQAITAGGNHHGLTIPFQFQGIGLGAGRSRDASRPLPTIIATRDNHGVIVPFISAFHNGPDGDRRNYPIDGQIPTMDTQNRFGLVAPFLQQLTHGGRLIDPAGPVPTITTANRGEIAACIPFIAELRHVNRPRDPFVEPLGTLTTGNNHAVVMPLIYAFVELAKSIDPRNDGERRLYEKMQQIGVDDVGFRMLQNHELSAAQGFPKSYIFHGNKGDITRQIGNSVPPPFSRAITMSLTGAA